VEYSTNLVDWYFLGPATPRYLFTDTNAPAVPATLLPNALAVNLPVITDAILRRI